MNNSLLNTNNMKQYSRFLSIALLASTLFFSSCSEDVISDPPNESELITDIVITMTNTLDASDVAVFNYSDPDGDAGSTVAMITGDTLQSGQNYNCSIDVFDKSKSPVDTVTSEIEEEANAHRFDFTLEGASAGKAAFNIIDKDDNNLPLGLTFITTVSPDAASSGVFRVTLNHFDKVTKGLENKDETDIDISFPIIIN